VPDTITENTRRSNDALHHSPKIQQKSRFPACGSTMTGGEVAHHDVQGEAWLVAAIGSWRAGRCGACDCRQES